MDNVHYVGLGRNGPFHPVSLLDVIPKLANYYAELLNNLVLLENWAKGVQPELPIESEKMEERFVDVVLDIENESGSLGFSRTQSRLKRLHEYLAATHLVYTFGQPELGHHTKAIREALQDDLKERTVFLPTIEQTPYFNNPKHFGDKVYDVFPLAHSDIVDAGNCYATDNFTACVFHLMRVGERGMRALAIHLKIRKVGKTTLEFCDWGIVASALKSKVEKLQQRKGRTAYKAMLLKRYADTASQADYMNEIWRKDIAHTRGNQPYNGPEALSVMTRVREFMQSVAECLHPKPTNE